MALSPSISTRSDAARVTTLELFFDLVFVLSVMQCTTLMAKEASWLGLGQGLLVLGLLWWSWVGYAWLTSVAEPETLAVRLPIFVAMSAFLVGALAVPRAFDDMALLFVGAYAVVRAANKVVLFSAAEDAAGRRSVLGLVVSASIGIALLLAGALVGGTAQLVLWSLALAFEMAGPFVFGAEDWKLVPGHFAERHGLIIIVALGESIVSIGLGAQGDLNSSVLAAGVAAVLVTAGFWWVYFDVLAHVAERQLHAASAGRVRNEMARDAYSYLHFPMVAGVSLVAIGFKKSLAHVSDELSAIGAASLLGGSALYLLGVTAFGLRCTTRLSRDSVLAAIALLALIPVAMTVPALAAMAMTLAVMFVLVVFKVMKYGEGRRRVRGRLLEPGEA